IASVCAGVRSPAFRRKLVCRVLVRKTTNFRLKAGLQTYSLTAFSFPPWVSAKPYYNVEVVTRDSIGNWKHHSTTENRLHDGRPRQDLFDRLSCRRRSIAVSGARSRSGIGTGDVGSDFRGHDRRRRAAGFALSGSDRAAIEPSATCPQGSRVEFRARSATRAVPSPVA